MWASTLGLANLIGRCLGTLTLLPVAASVDCF
jgi:hypothetical protein